MLAGLVAVYGTLEVRELRWLTESVVVNTRSSCVFVPARCLQSGIQAFVGMCRSAHGLQLSAYVLGRQALDYPNFAAMFRYSVGLLVARRVVVVAAFAAVVILVVAEYWFVEVALHRTRSLIDRAH